MEIISIIYAISYYKIPVQSYVQVWNIKNSMQGTAALGRKEANTGTHKPYFSESCREQK